MILTIPIFICIKGVSKRCPGKNKMLLPYAYSYLTKIGEINNVIIISEDNELLQYAQSLGFLNIYKEDYIENGDELLSISNYFINNHICYSYFFLFPICQPYKNLDLINKFKKNIDKLDSYDFITSKTFIEDRSIFYIDDHNNFINKSNNLNERKGSLCKTYYMIDGSLYLFKYSFFEKIMNTINKNSALWNSNFYTIENNSIFLDIDYKNDLNKFYENITYFRE